MFKVLTSLPLHWKILVSLVLAVIAGLWSGVDARFLGVSYYHIYEFFGELFLNALKMLIVPLIISSIIVGIMDMGSGNDPGRLGGKTLLYYICTSFLAITTGLLLVNLITPGIVNGEPIKDLTGLGDIPAEITFTCYLWVITY